jgi:hypothetical protein
MPLRPNAAIQKSRHPPRADLPRFGNCNPKVRPRQLHLRQYPVPFSFLPPRLRYQLSTINYSLSIARGVGHRLSNPPTSYSQSSIRTTRSFGTLPTPKNPADTPPPPQNQAFPKSSPFRTHPSNLGSARGGGRPANSVRRGRCLAGPVSAFRGDRDPIGRFTGSPPNCNLIVTCTFAGTLAYCPPWIQRHRRAAN